MASAPGLSLKIQVLDGPLSTQALIEGSRPGLIELSGWSAPFRPMKHGGTEMKEKTTAYPGNPEATQQVIGKKYLPTTMNGYWSDRYLGDGAAKGLCDVFEAILSAGATVQVSWGGTPEGDVSDTVRIGLLSKFDPTWDNPRDVAWEASFSWRGKGEAFVPAVAAAHVLNPREGFQEAVGDLATAGATAQTFLDRVLMTLGSPIPQAARDKVDRAVTDIASATDAIQAVTSMVTEAATFPAGAARAVVGAATLAVQAADDLEATYLNLDASVILLPTDRGIPLLLAKIQTFAMLESTDQVKFSATQAADGVSQMAEPEVIAEVTAPAGSDLRDLALKYYGDADSWWAIANFNNLATSAVPMPPTGPSDHPALVILIPRLQGGPQSDIRLNF
jgi:nucleoid-associated protein YgaU